MNKNEIFYVFRTNEARLYWFKYVADFLKNENILLDRKLNKIIIDSKELYFCTEFEAEKLKIRKA